MTQVKKPLKRLQHVDYKSIGGRFDAKTLNKIVTLEEEVFFREIRCNFTSTNQIFDYFQKLGFKILNKVKGVSVQYIMLFSGQE